MRIPRGSLCLLLAPPLLAPGVARGSAQGWQAQAEAGEEPEAQGCEGQGSARARCMALRLLHHMACSACDARPS
eukprot:2077973-Alexandrium_andersonii.AAC.1